jgi:hypothetical protein
MAELHTIMSLAMLSLHNQQNSSRQPSLLCWSFIISKDRHRSRTLRLSIATVHCPSTIRISSCLACYGQRYHHQPVIRHPCPLYTLGYISDDKRRSGPSCGRDLHTLIGVYFCSTTWESVSDTLHLVFMSAVRDTFATWWCRQSGILPISWRARPPRVFIVAARPSGLLRFPSLSTPARTHYMQASSPICCRADSLLGSWEPGTNRLNEVNLGTVPRAIWPFPLSRP